MNDVPPLIRMLIGEWRRRNMDIEYRGDGDTLHLIAADRQLVDEKVMASLKAAKKRLLQILKPLHAESGGKPVRLPQETA